MGGSGVELADGCRDCVVVGNRVFDASANGIMIGGPMIEDRASKGCQVGNNHVFGCGREFYGAIGIWVGFARGTVVSHNLVHDLPYSGISVGWQWNPDPTPCRENRIEYNHVFDVMNRLCDGGCIYTLGFQPGTAITGNHLHGVHRSLMAQGAPNNGIFIDQGSKGYVFERNVIYNTAAQTIRFNQCQREWHTWKDNYIGEAAEVKEAGKTVIEMAGLEPRWRERDELRDAAGDVSFVPEMEGFLELDVMRAGGSRPGTGDTQVAVEVERAQAAWKRNIPTVREHLTPQRVRDLSRWARKEMENYSTVPDLKEVALRPVHVDAERHKLVLESTVDTLPTHSPLVTRWLKVYVLYDLRSQKVAHVTVTIRGERLE